MLHVMSRTAYRIWWYDSPSAALIDYAQYFAILPTIASQSMTWSFQYSFRHTYRVHDMSTDAMARLWSEMAGDAQMMHTYASQVHVLQPTVGK